RAFRQRKSLGKFGDAQILARECDGLENRERGLGRTDGILALVIHWRILFATMVRSRPMAVNLVARNFPCNFIGFPRMQALRRAVRLTEEETVTILTGTSI